MKTKYILSVAVICILNFQTSDAQSWLWAKHAGGTDGDGYNKLVSDNNSDAYIAGYYSSDSCYFLTDTLSYSSFAGVGFFIAKYDANGNEQWVRGRNGTPQYTLNASVFDVAYDKTNNYIYLGMVSIGAGTIGGVTIAGTGLWGDAMIAKFDLSGNCIWAKIDSSTAYSYVTAIAVDSAGNVIIAGQNYATAYFDTIAVTAGGFLAKYDSSGNCLWAKKKFDTNTSAYGFAGMIRSLKAVKGDIFSLGMLTEDTLVVDADTAFSNFTSNQHFITCYDGNGTVKWIKACGGTSSTLGCYIAVDNDKNCYITGVFEQTGIFDNDTLTNPGAAGDFYLAKCDSMGNFHWAKTTNTSFFASGAGISLDMDNNIYVSGVFRGTSSFGTFPVNSVANSDMFLARYDQNGDCIGIRHTGEAVGGYVSVSDNHSIYVSGNFKNTVNFDSHSVTSYGDQDLFIVKSDEITGIGGEDRIASNQLLIYANPNKGTCNVTIADEFQHEKNLTLSIYDSKGNLVQQIPVQMNADKVSLNLEQEAKGVYNVILSNGRKSYNGKIVFE